MITTVVPSPSVDVTYVVDGFRLGVINRPSSVHRVAGGKGLNVARAAHRLGADVLAVALLGADTGAWIAEELARIGLRLHRVEAGEPTRTCVSIADSSRHAMTEVYEPAGPVDAARWSAFESAVADTLSVRPGWVTISGSLPEGSPPGATTRLVDLAHRAGRYVAVDLDGSALNDALTAEPDLVKVNVEEAARALGLAADAEPAESARLLAGRTRTGAVVSAGVGGAHGATADGATCHVGAVRRGRYPVGSGDSMLAGLVTRLDGGADLRDALLAASAVATANALVPGPACFALQDVEAILRELDAAGGGIP